jgi:hypothetical protein
MSMIGSPNPSRGNAPLARRLKIDDLHAQLAPLDRYGLPGLSFAMTGGARALVRGFGIVVRRAVWLGWGAGRDCEAT